MIIVKILRKLCLPMPYKKKTDKNSVKCHYYHKNAVD